MKITMRDVFIGVIIATILAALFSTIGAKAAAGANEVQQVVLNSSNHVAIRDEVNDTSVNNALHTITQSDSRKPFYIFLDSPGGSVFAGRRLVSFLQTTDRNITCVAHTAISMAFVILQACPTRLMTNHGVLMSHQISSNAKGSLNEMKAALILTQKLADLYDNMMAARMGLSLEAYRAKINPEFWMIGIQDGLSNRAVDAEAKVTCTKDLEKAFDTYGEGKEAVKISKCPVA